MDLLLRSLPPGCRYQKGIAQSGRKSKGGENTPALAAFGISGPALQSRAFAAICFCGFVSQRPLTPFPAHLN